MITAQQIRQERQRLLTEARALRDSITDDNPSDEQQQRFDALFADIDRLGGEAQRAEAFEQRMSALENEQTQIEDRISDPLPHNDPGNTRQGRHQFSVLRAIRDASFGRLSGIEAEVTQEVASRRSQPVGPNQFYMPPDLTIDTAISRTVMATAERRDLTTSTAGGGIPTITPPRLIEFLRNLMLTRRLGATVLTGLSGNLSLPKQTAASSAGWAAEGAAFSEQDPTIGTLDFSPNRVGAFAEYTRTLLHQSSLDIENFVRQDLAMAVAIELDRTVINGSGTAPEPQGILQNSNVNTVALGTNGGAPTWKSIVDLEKEVNKQNALTGTLHYLTTANAVGKLKTVEKASGTAEFIASDVPIVEGSSGITNGRPLWSSEQVPSNLTKGTGSDLSAAIFGDWASAHLALFGEELITVNPFSLDTQSMTRVVIEQLADFEIRHAESFAKIIDMITT